MPTIVEKRIITNGTGDYTSLSAWEAARQGDIVAGDTIEKALCDGGVGSPLDANICIFGGWTTDSEHYIWVFGVVPLLPRSPAAIRGYYMESNVGNNGMIRAALNGGANHIVIDRIQIGVRPAAGVGISFFDTNTAPGFYKVSRCIIRARPLFLTPNGAIGIRILSRTKAILIWNCLISGFGSTGPDTSYSIFYQGDNCDIYIYNCTIHGEDAWNEFAGPQVGIGSQSIQSRVVVKNTVVQSMEFGFLFPVSTPGPGSGYNTGCREDEIFGIEYIFGEVLFVNVVAGSDYHLVMEDINARRRGIDLSGDPIVQFFDDLEGTPRLQVWDRGCDQITQEDHLWPDRVKMLNPVGWYSWIGDGPAPGSAGGSGDTVGGYGGEGGGEIPGAH